MMRRFIIHLLIFVTLATNVAWAMDECFLPFCSDNSALIQPGDLSGNSPEDGVCDTFCAGWFHLVGITPGTQFDYPVLARQGVAHIDLPYHSPDQHPPIRPPKI